MKGEERVDHSWMAPSGLASSCLPLAFTLLRGQEPPGKGAQPEPGLLTDFSPSLPPTF